MKSQNVKVKINGLNLLRIINRAADAGILIENLMIKPKYIVFEVNPNSFILLKKICKSEHKHIIILKQGLMNRLLNNATYLLGIIVSLCIIFSYFYSYSKVVYSVEVVSSSEETKILTEDYLYSNGISAGSVINIPTKKLEQKIVSNISQISGCSVRFNGGYLKIYIYSGEEKSLDPENIKSKFNAIITSINVYAGKTKYKIGDIVKKGDVLISNEAGCSGEVIGKVVSSSKIIYNEKSQVAEKTGRIFEQKEIIVFNKFFINKCKIAPFSTFIEEKCDFFDMNNFLFPFKILIRKYYETALVDKFIPFENVQDEVKSKALNQAKKDIVDESKITNVTYSCVRFENYVVVDCFVEFETNLF